MGELIQGEGYECTVAYSAAEAEKHFNKLAKDIHVVILDLMMARSGTFIDRPLYQGETGDELYDHIRQIAPTIPMIIITAKTRETIKARYFSDRFTNVFFKPVNPEMISQILEILKKL